MVTAVKFKLGVRVPITQKALDFWKHPPQNEMDEIPAALLVTRLDWQTLTG
jgi:hypothetical protein